LARNDLFACTEVLTALVSGIAESISLDAKESLSLYLKELVYVAFKHYIDLYQVHQGDADITDSVFNGTEAFQLLTQLFSLFELLPEDVSADQVLIATLRARNVTPVVNVSSSNLKQDFLGEFFQHRSKIKTH
jgi:hypothetical protein